MHSQGYEWVEQDRPSPIWLQDTHSDKFTLTLSSVELIQFNSLWAILNGILPAFAAYIKMFSSTCHCSFFDIL